MRFTLHSRPLRGAALLLALSPAFGQNSPKPAVTLVEPAPPLLPRQFGAWQQQPDTSATAALDAAAKDVLLEDGLYRYATSTYKRDNSNEKRDNSNETIDLKSYQFGDATGAFSAFTYLRGPKFRPVAGATVGTTSVQQGDSVLTWDGPNVVAAQFHGGRRVADLADLVAVLPKASGAKGLSPLLPVMLPAKGLQPETLKYALGSAGYEAMGGVLPASIVGFDKSAEVVTAKYVGRGTLTLLLYPTPQIAGDHGRQIEAEMNREIAAGHSPGTVKLRREGPLVLLTTGAWKPADAQAIVEGTHLRDQLSWDKPVPIEFHAEVQKTASLLLTIAELSIALMLAALVLGLFFGGGRAAIRVLQGKPAATEPEFLRIDLREGPGESGSFKPLH